MVFPRLETSRLILIPVKDFKGKECINLINDLTQLLNNKNIYKLTFNIPSPYMASDAKKFVSDAPEKYKKRGTRHYSIFTKDNKQLIGGIAISYNKSDKNGEIAYWIGENFWSKGYCSEAVEEIIFQAFTNWEYNRIFAHYYLFNKASKKVMEKNGMKFEGVLREEKLKGECYYDIGIYSILKSEFKISD